MTTSACRLPLLTFLALCGLTAGIRAAPLPPPAIATARAIPADAHLGEASGDADFLFRLGLLEGHLLVGHELIQAHQPALALPHFGHPVRELYDDIAEYLKTKGFPPFDKELVALEAAVAAAPDSSATEAKYQAVIAIVHKARETAPAELRASIPEMIKLCSNTIDAASGEFGEALERGRIAAVVEYHDSRGFLEYVDQQLKAMKAEHADAAARARIDRLQAILAKAQWIVGELLPAPTPRASVGTYRAIAAEALALAKE